MKKSLIIKLAVAVVTILLSYCVFWLFKIGQSERKITSIVQKSKIISFDKISSSGFPFSQKITIENLKINIPVNAIVKRNFIAKKLEISSSIFSNNFKAKIIEEVEIKTLDGVTYYYPMALRRNGKLFKEWVYLTDNIYPTREAALDIVNKAKAIETNYEISKNVQFLYIK